MISIRITLDRINYFDIDVDNDSNFPITTAVTDVRSIGSRTGTYSKAIKLVDTPNNHKILNHVYEFTSNIPSIVYKRVYAQVLNNGVVVADNLYFMLDSVIENENSYTINAKLVDSVGGLFASADNATLRDLDFTDLTHKYSSDVITDSFSNTYEDGYIYHLPYNFSNDIWYLTKDFYPGIFVKTILDKVHSSYGYTYILHGEDNHDIQFKNLIMPFTGDLVKMLEDDLLAYKSIVEAVPSPYILTINSANDTTKTANNIFNSVTELQDPFNLWNSGKFKIDVGTLAPQLVKWTGKLDLEMKLKNNSGWIVYNVYQNTGGQTELTDNSYTIFVRARNITTNTVVASQEITPTNFIQIQGEDGMEMIDGKLRFKSEYSIEADETITLASGTGLPFTLEWTDTNPDHEYRIEVFARFEIANATKNFVNYTTPADNGTPANIQLSAEIANLQVNTSLVSDSLMVGQDIPMGKFVPMMKQNDFIRSIMQVYNLYVIPDEHDDTLLHYYTRDDFYDMGYDWGDLTYRLQTDKEIKQQILPELLNRTVLLSYTQDTKDAVLTNYTGTTGEIVGQNRIVFSNENVKGEHKITPIFCPTSNIMTSFNASVPYLPYIPNVGPKLLLLGDMEDCDVYSIANSASGDSQYWLNQYRFTGMYNHPETPSFSIEYGACDYYATNVYPTTNNLYNHYARQMQNINKSRLVTVYMYIDDIYRDLKINDTLIIRGQRYYINRIVDWNPTVNTYTKIELVTADEVRDVQKQKSPNISMPSDTGVILPGNGTVKPNKGSNGIFTDIFDVTINNNVIKPGSGVVISDVKGKILDKSHFNKFEIVDFTVNQINGQDANIAIHKIIKETRDNIALNGTIPNTTYDFSDGSYLVTDSLGSVSTNKLAIRTLKANIYANNPPFSVYTNYVLNDDVIYAQKIWRNISGNNGSAISFTELSSADWEVVSLDKDYETIYVDAFYNDEVLIAVRDDRNNVIHGVPSITIGSFTEANKYMYVDYLSPNFFGNRCEFYAGNVFSEFAGNDCGIVSGNDCGIVKNVKAKDFMLNRIDGDVYDVISLGDVYNNLSVLGVTNNNIYSVNALKGIMNNDFTVSNISIYNITVNGYVGDDTIRVGRSNDVTQTIVYI